jgi:hypothetical protein
MIIRYPTGGEISWRVRLVLLRSMGHLAYAAYPAYLLTRCFSAVAHIP